MAGEILWTELLLGFPGILLCSEISGIFIMFVLLVSLISWSTAFAVVLVQYLECFLQCTCGAYVP